MFILLNLWSDYLQPNRGRWAVTNSRSWLAAAPRSRLDYSWADSRLSSIKSRDVELGVWWILELGSSTPLQFWGTGSWESNEKSGCEMGVRSWELDDLWELGVGLPNNFGDWELEVRSRMKNLSTSHPWKRSLSDKLDGLFYYNNK